MRHLAWVPLGLLMLACPSDSPITTDSGDPPDETSSSSGGGGATTSTGSTGSATDIPTTGSGSGAAMCVPGQSDACTCINGDPGAQVCAEDGLSYGPCMCEGSETTVEPITTSTTDPDTTATGTSTTTGTTTGTTTDTDTDTDTTTGAACIDPGPEPNDDPMAAVPLADQPCDGAPDMLAGVLDGDADVDWFSFVGQFGGMCGMNDPKPMFTLNASDVVRMCVYFVCATGTTNVDCQGTATPDMLGPATGCCDMGVDISAFLNCSGSNDETATVFVALDQAPADACVDYSVEYLYEGM